MTLVAAYPSGAAARDRFILAHRRPRAAHDPWRAQGLIFEDERTWDGSITCSATLFLTGRECRWRCVMCDLWQYTIQQDTPPGAVAAQVASARTEIAMAEAAARSAARPLRPEPGTAPSGRVTQIKLYNAASFFDPRAVADGDYDRVAASVSNLERVVVESHPSLVGDRTARFVDALARHSNRSPSQARQPVLEVAMGLETAHPEALERLNKRMTREDFARAAARLASMSVSLRTFLLVSPPFIPAGEQDRWLLRSIEFAVDCGSSVVVLIPTRPGNGALDEIAGEGQFQPPTLAGLERAFSLSLRSERVRTAGTRVFADLWDLDRFSSCGHCFESRRRRLHALNLDQTDLPQVRCAHCTPGASMTKAADSAVPE